MNERAKTLWLEALRSGEYRQCSGSLVDQDGAMCVMGVLNAVYFKDVPDAPGIKSWEEKRHTDPLAMQRWAGLGNWLQELALSGKWPMTINDAGTSFSELADMIEEQV